MSDRKIFVTQSFVPEMDAYTKYLQRSFDNKWLTNRGELTLELEARLKSHLGLNHLILMTNGTLPIQIALKILGKGGEVITTPFSYIATTSSIFWENCTPKFVDIDPSHFTIDETKIEDAITDETTAILATHVFGNPCNIEAIQVIAERHNLHVIYDAAHCFGVKYKGESIFNQGDISTCSFHATKIFHTGEGGALICNNPEYREQTYYSHNFGHNGPIDFHGLGINGKISELQSAMGLAVLDKIDTIFDSRKSTTYLYSKLLTGHLKTMTIREGTEWNYSYFPVAFKSEEDLLRTEKALAEQNIFPRRYFYPSLNTIEYVQGEHMPEAEQLASRILCLPLFVGISEAEVELICSIILKNK